MSRYFPIIGWLRTYRRDWLPFDLIAGLTTGAVVIPKAMAMATVAGLPVELGLYTALLPMLIYAVMGTSRTLSMSTTATIGILTGAALKDAVHAGTQAEMIAATATLSLLVGAALLLVSMLKLGTAANFISDPVLTGFKIGLGLIIVADQIPKMLGIHFEKAGYFRDLGSIWRHLPETSTPTLLLGVTTLALVVAMEKPAELQLRGCSDWKPVEWRWSAICRRACPVFNCPD
jgi:SulP family sulfate permease